MKWASLFDFGFGADSGFTVYHCDHLNMDKQYLIKSAEKGLWNSSCSGIWTKPAVTLLRDSQWVYHAYPQSGGINYYVTDIPCSHLVKMQLGPPKKTSCRSQFSGNMQGGDLTAS
jgi:hypothetical protein